jgi:hypothetical protein
MIRFPSAPSTRFAQAQARPFLAGVLFVRNVHMLEGFAYDERWPAQVRRFTLSYRNEPRRLLQQPA